MLASFKAFLWQTQPKLIGRPQTHSYSALNFIGHFAMGSLCAYRSFTSIKNLIFNPAGFLDDEPTSTAYREESKQDDMARDLVASVICGVSTLLAFNFTALPLIKTPQWLVFCGYLASEAAYAYSYYYQSSSGLLCREPSEAKDRSKLSLIVEDFSNLPTLKLIINAPSFVVSLFSRSGEIEAGI